jgi:hypothetical protein
LYKNLSQNNFGTLFFTNDEFLPNLTALALNDNVGNFGAGSNFVTTLRYQLPNTMSNEVRVHICYKSGLPNFS